MEATMATHPFRKKARHTAMEIVAMDEHDEDDVLPRSKLSCAKIAETSAKRGFGDVMAGAESDEGCRTLVYKCRRS